MRILLTTRQSLVYLEVNVAYYWNDKGALYLSSENYYYYKEMPKETAEKWIRYIANARADQTLDLTALGVFSR